MTSLQTFSRVTYVHSIVSPRFGEVLERDVTRDVMARVG